MRLSSTWLICCLAAFATGCTCGDGGLPALGDGGTDADADADTDSDTDADTDSDTDADTDSDTECPEGWCDDVCCAEDEACWEGACLPIHGECQDHPDCQEDSCCFDGSCFPWGAGPCPEFNEECTQTVIAGLFQPSIQCEWTAPPEGDPYPDHVRVLSTPLVIDFDFDDDPGTIEPSIVVMTYDGDDGSSGYYNGAYGVIRVLDGRTCELQYNVGTQLNGCNTPAIADLDLDGRPDIAAHTGLGGLVIHTWNGATDQFEVHCEGALAFGAQSTGWAGPSIYDLDADGVPEILTGGVTYDADCTVLDQSLGLTGNMYSGAGYPVVGDLDGVLDEEDLPTVELATGSGLYRFDRTTKVWTEVWSGGEYQGYIALADFGTFTEDPADDDRTALDGIAEVVTVRAPNLHITTMGGRLIFGPVAMPSGQGGGPPTVGDFDGDGRAEVSCSGSDSIAVFDIDCTGTPDADFCDSLATDGILWWQPSQDHSSNRTGSSLFDFEGDGRAEVIYADEVFTRVYDGRTGEVVFSQWHSSCTWNEYPVVADVDGDFRAELVVPSNENCTIVPTTAGSLTYPESPNGFPMDPLFRGLPCEVGTDCGGGVCDAGYCRCLHDSHCGGTGSGFVCAVPPLGTPGLGGDTCRAEWRGPYNGVRVYADVLDRWVGSRTIWSQFSYSVTHIGENGTVVPTELWEQNWLVPGMNHFRQNVQGDAPSTSSPDLTVGQGVFEECDEDDHAVLSAEVCNRGTQPVGAGVEVTFYVGDPANQEVACVAHTTWFLFPGACQTVSCTWTDPPGNDAPADITVVVDDGGAGPGAYAECIEENNTAVIGEVGCLAGVE
jgi:hypothetical protein